MKTEKKKKINKKILNMLKRENKYLFSLEDPKYNSRLLNKFINKIIKNGKKTKALKIIFFMFKLLKRKYYKNPFKLFKSILFKLQPFMDIKVYTIAGKPFYIPYMLHLKNNERTSFNLMYTWIKNSINYVITKNYYQFSIKLFYEINNLLIYFNDHIKNINKIETYTTKIKKNLQKMILENKKNMHFRWKK